MARLQRPHAGAKKRKEKKKTGGCLAIKSAIEDAGIFADPSDNWNNLATLRGAMGSLARDVVALQLDGNYCFCPRPVTYS